MNMLFDPKWIIEIFMYKYIDRLDMSHESSGSEGTSNCQDNYKPLSGQGLCQRFIVYDTDKKNFKPEENHEALESSEIGRNECPPPIPQKRKEQRSRNDWNEVSNTKCTNSDIQRDQNDCEEPSQSMGTNSYKQRDRNGCVEPSQSILHCLLIS